MTPGPACAALVTPAPVRAAALLLADWLEHRSYQVLPRPDQDLVLVQVAADGWAQGYRRAIYELRAGAAEPVQVPDDISELDGSDQ
jgi:hypothetical protein